MEFVFTVLNDGECSLGFGKTYELDVDVNTYSSREHEDINLDGDLRYETGL